MSIPNFENIDRWFFEYTEGNLSADQESQLLDFLELHPEMKPDLKTWKNAKVKAPLHQPFANQNLIKETPFLLRPLSLVSIATLAILFSWLGIQSIPVTPLYVQSKIDTDIIETEFEEDIFFEQLSVIANNKDQKSVNKISNDVTFQRILASNSIVNSLYNDIVVIEKNSSDRNSAIQREGREYLVQKAENRISIENINWEDQARYEIEKNYAFNSDHQSIQSNHLEGISNYLNNMDKTNNKSSIDKEGKKYSNNLITKKHSLANSLKSTFRKIRRIANYPVALQNTKSPHFHAPMMTGFNANFAMVGSAPGNRIQATSRKQWINESNSQLMNTLSWDGYIEAIRGGFGIDVSYNNYQGNEINNYTAAITYSPKFSISKKVSFEPAVRFKMGVVNLDQNSSSIGNTIEIDRENIIPLFKDEQQVNGQQLWYRDIGLGFMFNTELFYAGLNADNIGRHNNNFYSEDLNTDYKSDIHYTAVLGTEYGSKTKEIRLSGYGLYQKYGDLEEIWLGTNFRYEWLQIGAAASSNLDLAGSFGTVFKKFSFHYNVDYTKSRLLDRQILSHQVTMRILLKPNRYDSKLIKL